MKNLKMLLISLFIGFNSIFSQVYIDPGSNKNNQDGSITYPFTSFDKVTFVANRTYLVKRATIMTVYKRIFVRPNNITIKAYGVGDRPVIVSMANIKEKIFDISLTQNFYMRDIVAYARDTALTVINFQGSPNATIINCQFSKAMFGIRNINSRNKMIIDSCEVFDIQQDGVYCNGLDSVIIRNSHIRNINQAYFINHSEKSSYGDAVQLDGAKWFCINNTILDRSDTGNKFCFITGSGNCLGSIFENNKCLGNPNLGACLFLINTKGLIIRGNLFLNAPIVIAGTDILSKVYKNQFINISNKVLTHAIRSKQEYGNNTFINCNTGLSSWSDTLIVKDNIFFKVQKPFEGNFIKSSNNLFY